MSLSAAASVDSSQWEEKVKAYHLPRAEINKVVMEYLVKEGFKEVGSAYIALYSYSHHFVLCESSSPVSGCASVSE